MKVLLNWRYYIITALFAVGVLAIAAIFGEDNRPLFEWICARIGYAGIAAVAFYIMAKLTAIWSALGEIPEMTNLTNTEEHGNQD